jgi:hypothetical protein
MTKRATKAPKDVDWRTLKDRTPLTLELSRRGLTTMTDDLAAKRIYVALHEAAHFLIHAHDGLELWDVTILGVRGKSTEAGCDGSLMGANHNNQLLPLRAHYAGTIHEQLITGQDTCAGTHDWADALEYLVNHCTQHGISPDDSLVLAGDHARAVKDILTSNWNLVRVIAGAFIVHSDAAGRIHPGKALTLYRYVQQELRLGDSGGIYGDCVLDRNAIPKRYMSPATVVAKLQQEWIERTKRQPWLRKFVGGSQEVMAL